MTSVVPNHADCEPMSDADLKRIDRLLAKARTALVLEHPFIGNIALNMPFVADHSIRTAMTNGKEMTPDQSVQYLDKVCTQVLEPFIDKKYEELCRYVNGYDQKMKMKRECIADKAIWTAKKSFS